MNRLYLWFQSIFQKLVFNSWAVLLMLSPVLHLGRAQHKGAWCPVPLWWGQSSLSCLGSQCPGLPGQHGPQAKLDHTEVLLCWDRGNASWLAGYSGVKWCNPEVWGVSFPWGKPWPIEQGDHGKWGRYMSLFFVFCGVLSCSICWKSFWKVLLTEGMNMPLQCEHLLAAYPEEWLQSNICFTLVVLSLSLPSTFLLHIHLTWLALPAWRTSTLILASDYFLVDEDKIIPMNVKNIMLFNRGRYCYPIL